MKLGERGGGEDLEGVGKSETMTRIYCMEIIIFNNTYYIYVYIKL